MTDGQHNQGDMKLVDPPIAFDVFRQRPDTPQELLALVESYRKAELEPPPHQRDPEAWDLKKRREWITRLCDVQQGKAQNPLGVICVYMLSESRDTRTYLNDGLQRIAASLHALNNPEMYGKTKEDIWRVLRLTSLQVQNRVYKDHEAASEDFRLVNAGLWLEPTEKHRSHLVYAPNWATIWERAIDRWHADIRECLASYCRSRTPRTWRLRTERHNLQLFTVALKGAPKLFGKDDQLERTVVSCFREKSEEDAKRAMKKIEAYSAEIEKVWRNLYPEPGAMMQEALAKWLIGARLLNPTFPPRWWDEFYAKLLVENRGEAKFDYKHKSANSDFESNKTEFLTTRLEVFPKVCRKLGIEIPEGVRRAKGRLVKRGFQNDHKQSFADFGEGATRPMPAISNAAKNARLPL